MKKLFPYWPVFATLFFIAIIVIVLHLCVISPISSSINQNIEKAKPSKSASYWRDEQNMYRRGIKMLILRKECESNLNQIWHAIQMYSQDNRGRYPNKNGAEGFEMLREGGYFKNVNICTCPATKTIIKDGDKLTENNVDYVYIGGYNERTAYHDSDISIVYDKPTNYHGKYGNILSVDGHVFGYAGENWMSNIKK